MGASIMDYLILAKAGYKKADIDQIITLSKQEEETNPEGQQAATANIENKTASAEPLQASEKEEKPEPAQEEIDYKSLYEKSQEDLKAAQAANRTIDNSPNLEDRSAELKSIVASYL